MPVKRWITPIDIIIFSILALLPIGFIVGAVLTPQHWDIPKIIASIITPLAFLGFSSGYIIKRWTQKPDYIVPLKDCKEDGISVWGSFVKQEVMKNAANYFICEFSKLTDLNELIVYNAIKQSSVQWTKTRITMMGPGWYVKDKAGLQKGKRVIVHWNGSIRMSALFHEWIHMVDDYVRGAEEGPQYVPDYKHDKIKWWSYESALAVSWTKKHIE
jgi:hypothetical protein